jgi:hypothetical protein
MACDALCWDKSSHSRNEGLLQVLDPFHCKYLADMSLLTTEVVPNHQDFDTADAIGET